MNRAHATSKNTNWGSVRLGAFASPQTPNWRTLPPLANRVTSAALIPAPLAQPLFMRVIAHIGRLLANWKLPNWGSVHEGAFASPQTQVWRILPPSANRVRSAALIPIFFIHGLARRSALAERARRGVANELGDRPQAMPLSPPVHAHGGSSPHQPAVSEALCRSPFFFQTASGAAFCIGKHRHRGAQ